MKKKLIIITSIIGLLTLTIVVYYYNFVILDTKNHYNADVMTDLSNLKNAFIVYQSEIDSYPINNNDENKEQNIMKVREIIEGDNIKKVSYIDKVDELYIDPWGSYYHICFDIDKDHVIKLKNHLFKGDIALWSNGPNKINEYGEGDDIILLWNEPK